MLGVMLLQPASTGRLNKKSNWVKTWLQNVKILKKAGIKLRDAILLSPEGETMSKDGEETITHNDIMLLRDILLNQPGCMDVLHLDNLYYCVKQLTEDMIVLFNGSNYIVACVTDSEHFLLVNVKGRRLESERTIHWIQDVVDELQHKYR